MRKKNSIINMIVGLVGQLLNMLLSFGGRMVFVHYLSQEYLGVNGLFGDVLGMLNLAELGIGSAMIFSMYRPAAQNDEKQLARLMNLYRTLYRIVALAVLGIVAMMSVVYNDLSYAVNYHAWWHFLRELFYPTGLLAGGLALLAGGGIMSRKMRRYAKYLACAGQRDAIPLAHLMKAADVGESKAERDLEVMVEKGMWGPDAYLDRGNDMLFHSQDAANAYFAERRAASAQQPAQPAAVPEAQGDEGTLEAIRRANDRIDDPVLSAKIDRLEAITRQIFKVIQEEPAKKAKASTFLNYYLPTTQKLLDSYADFEEAGVSGQNLDQAKARIQETMDNIIAGFEHQLDELYRDAALDIDSDIRVMETMLKRDTSTVADDFGLDGGTAVQMPGTEVE